LADFSSVLRKAVSLTLGAFLIISSYTLHYSNLGRATHSTNKKQGKREKLFFTGRGVLGSSKW
jgi:hypothetical protein